MGDVIEACGLTKTVWRSTLVRDVSFSVGAGRVVGLLGPNGAGKTTIIRMLLGLSRVSEGVVKVSGEEVPTRALRRVGSLVDPPGLYPWMSAPANLQVLAPGVPWSARIDLLAQVGLDGVGNKLVRVFSHGMRQRLALAVAIGNGRDALVLDEPMNGVDPIGIREFRVLVRSLAHEGRAVLVSSHQLDEMQRVCDDVVILHRGHVVDRLSTPSGAADGTPSSLEQHFLQLTTGLEQR
jgi:ABC-2 type transport system ATP-binding protein